MTHSPALRLLAAHGRLVTRRPLVLARAAAARVRGRTAWAVWPHADEPIQAVDVATRSTSRYMRRVYREEARTRRAVVDAARSVLGPAAWDLVRAGALLEPDAPGLAARAVAHVLPDAADDQALVLYSPSGSQLAKAVCFVFAPGRDVPDAVVLAMADPRWSDRLRRETELVEQLRERLAGHPSLADGLPSPPLGRFEPDGDFAVVVRPDPLAGRTGDVVAPDRELAWRWLREFQAATASGASPLTAAEVERGVADVREAWALLGPEAAERGARCAERALAAAAGAPLPGCAVHGDFWRGNVSHHDGALRVFDWEWGRLDGRPLFDLWTYELTDAELESGRPRDALTARLREAHDRVAAELAGRGLAPSLAATGLPLAAAELLLRFRRATGRPGPAERALLPLLEPIEDVLGLHAG
jgi:hypothetical protein